MSSHPIRTTLALAALATALILTSCSAISTGTVTDRKHTDSYVITQLVCTGFNSKGVCQSWTPILQTMPEQWSLTLQQGQKSGAVTVTEAQYNACTIGSTYPNCATAQQRLNVALSTGQENDR